MEYTVNLAKLLFLLTDLSPAAAFNQFLSKFIETGLSFQEGQMSQKLTTRGVFGLWFVIPKFIKY